MQDYSPFQSVNPWKQIAEKNRPIAPVPKKMEADHTKVVPKKLTAKEAAMLRGAFSAVCGPEQVVLSFHPEGMTAEELLVKQGGTFSFCMNSSYFDFVKGKGRMPTGMLIYCRKVIAPSCMQIALGLTDRTQKQVLKAEENLRWYSVFYITDSGEVGIVPTMKMKDGKGGTIQGFEDMFGYPYPLNEIAQTREKIKKGGEFAQRFLSDYWGPEGIRSYQGISFATEAGPILMFGGRYVDAHVKNADKRVKQTGICVTKNHKVIAIVTKGSMNHKEFAEFAKAYVMLKYGEELDSLMRFDGGFSSQQAELEKNARGKDASAGKSKKKGKSDRVPAFIGILNKEIYNGIPTRWDGLSSDFWKKSF